MCFGEYQQLDSWADPSRSHLVPSEVTEKARSKVIADRVILGRDLPAIEPPTNGQSQKAPYLELLPARLAAWPSYTGGLGLGAVS